MVWLLGCQLVCCQLYDGRLGDCPQYRLAQKLLELVVVSLKIVGSMVVVLEVANLALVGLEFVVSESLMQQ